MYGNNKRKDGEDKWKYNTIRVLHHVWTDKIPLKDTVQ